MKKVLLWAIAGLLTVAGDTAGSMLIKDNVTRLGIEWTYDKDGTEYEEPYKLHSITIAGNEVFTYREVWNLD